MEKIQISQGYSNCSIAVIDENAVIVSDKKIAETLEQHGVDVLYLDYIPDIKLLDGKNNYSKMNGFIGGTIVRIEDKIIVFGDLSKIDRDNKILNFIRKYNFEIFDFADFDVIDYGGILVV